MIKLLVLDIDGIFTDGSVYCDPNGGEFKQIRYNDLDAVGRLSSCGIKVVLMTGEQGPMADFWRKKLPGVSVYTGCKDKLDRLVKIASELGVSQQCICYVGDSPRDAAAINWAGLGVCPSGVASEVRRSARLVLQRQSGTGVVEEIADYLLAMNNSISQPFPNFAVKAENKIVAVIPARGGSKRIPNKNLLVVGGQPMIAWAIQHARASKYIDSVYVSTDSPRIAAIARDFGAEVPFIRPAEFATDDATDIMVFRHFLNWWKEQYPELPDLLVQVRATCPLRDVTDLDNSIATMLEKKDADSLRSVTVARYTPYKAWNMEGDGSLSPLLHHETKDWYDGPTQKLPKVWVQDGMVDIVRPQTILEQDSMAGKKILSHATQTPMADIDTKDDLIKVGELLQKRRIEGKEPPLHIAARIGIIQGRLTQPTNGQLQCFPQDWKKEFEIASSLRYSYIEWLIPRGNNKDNPIWRETQERQIAAVTESTGVAASVVCLDPVLDISVADADVPTIYQWAENLRQGKSFGVEGAVLPLMEASKPGDNPDALVRGLERLGNAVSSLGIKLHLEITDAPKKVISILERLDPNLFGYCFDTGNLRAAGINEVEAFEQMADYTTHIHVKDVLEGGERKLLGEGIVDFSKVVRRALRRGYEGRFTFETPRGNDPAETAAHHRSLLIAISNQE